MSAYTVSALAGTIRIALWFVVLFVVLPRRLFSDTASKSRACSPFDPIVRMAFASILSVHLLAFLHVYDFFSLLAAYAVIYAGYRAWRSEAPLREGVRRTWRRLVTLSLNVLEGRVHLSEMLGAKLADTGRRLARALPRGADLLWALVFITVLAAGAYLRLEEPLRHPAPTSPDYYLHLLWTKALGVNRLYVDGVYAYGSHALFQVLHQFTVLNEALLLRLAPGLAGALLAATIYWTVARLTDRRGPATIAAALYGIFTFAGWLPLRLDLQGDVLAVEVALIFLPPTFVFLTEAIAGGSEGPKDVGENSSAPLHPRTPAPLHLRTSAPLLFFQGMACLFLIHPFVGALALVGLITALLTTAVLDRKADGTWLRLLGLGIAAAVLGALPLLIGLAQGKSLHLGPLRWDAQFLGAALRAGRFLGPAPPAPEPTWLLAVGAAGALWLLLWPSRWGNAGRTVRAAGRVFGGFTLMLVVLFQPAKFHLPELLLPAQVARVLALVLCVVVGLALYQAWVLLWSASRLVGWSASRLVSWRNHLTTRPPGGLAGPNTAGVELGVTAMALAAMLLTSPALTVPPAPKREYDIVAEQLYRIKREFPTYKWTVVGYPEALPHVFGRGFFVSNESFLDRYRPETWRFDPRKPELAIPTPHVFIFVERRPFVRVGSTAEEADRREAIGRRLQDWTGRYEGLHDDVSRYYENDSLVIYHIYRPPEVEQRILEEIESERRQSDG